MIYREDTSVRERQTAEVNPPSHGISAVVELLSGLRIECIKYSRPRVQKSLLFSAFLVSVFSGREGKYDAICNDHRIGQIEISRHPLRLKDRTLGLRIGNNFESHDATVLIISVCIRELRCVDGRGSPHGHEQPGLTFVISRGRKAAPDAQPFTADITIITQLRGREQGGLMIPAPKRVRVQKVYNTFFGSARQEVSILPAEPHRARCTQVQVTAIQIGPIGR